jgi:aminopeptidase N
MKANKSFVVASTGNLQSGKEEGDYRISNYTATVVRDFAMVFSPDFQVKTLTVGDTTINYYFVKDAEPERSLETARLSLVFFSEKFGEYPYDVLNVVETCFLHGGMEYPQLVYISYKVEGERYLEVIVHEIAHQWWYAIVGNDQIKHGWLDEGLTEYSTTLFYEFHPEYNQTRQKRIGETLRNYLIYVDVYKSIRGDIDTSMNRPSHAFTTEFEYTYMTYVKGELMFDTLRTTIGDKAFFDALKLYYRENKFKTATPADLISAFERTSKAKLGGFFSSWLEGKIIIGA